METTATTNKTMRKDLYMIDPRNVIVVEGFNSRVDFDIDSLCESIKENGVLNPITVIKTKDEDGEEKYRLVDGERRYRSVMKLIEDGVEIARIPAIQIPQTLSDAELLVQQIVRNDGKPFNEYEYAIACEKFEKYGWTKKEIATKLGKNPGMITYYLQHLSRDKRIVDLIKDGTISGAEVRRIYSRHKNNEEGAVNEILKAKAKNEALGKEKKKITLADLDVNGRTIIARDSQDIFKGVDKLFYYYNKFSNNGEINISINLDELHTKLKSGETIDNILTEAMKGSVSEAV